MSELPPPLTSVRSIEQPRNITFVPVASVQMGPCDDGLEKGSTVRLLPVQTPCDVPLTDQPATLVAGFLGGTAVHPMIRKRQSPLNVMFLRRPATHSKRHDSSVKSLLGPGTEFTANTRSRLSPLADLPWTVRPSTKQP